MTQHSTDAASATQGVRGARRGRQYNNSVAADAVAGVPEQLALAA